MAKGETIKINLEADAAFYLLADVDPDNGEAHITSVSDEKWKSFFFGGVVNLREVYEGVMFEFSKDGKEKLTNFKTGFIERL